METFRFWAIGVAVLAVLLATYTIGAANGFSGCVASVNDNFTNRMLRMP